METDMKSDHRQSGFTVVEMLMALVILATLMTAVAVAFDASVKNYHENEAMYKAINTGRAALLRITNDIRTAGGVAMIAEETNAATQCTIDLDGDDTDDVIYRYDDASDTLFLDDLAGGGTSYVLCGHVTALTFTRGEGQDSNGDACVRNVRITLTVTDEAGELDRTLAAAAVVRRNL